MDEPAHPAQPTPHTPPHAELRPPRRTTSRRRLLVAAGVGLAGGVVAARAVLDDDRARRPVPALPAGRSVTEWGAVGDGRTDDTDALRRAFAAAAAGDTLVLPAGRTFAHHAVLALERDDVTLVGPGALLATDEEHSALRIEGDRVRVEAVRLGVARTTRRWSTPDQHRVVVTGTDGALLRDVQVTGSAAAGIFLLGSRGFRLERVSVSDTRADGVHLTHGAHDGVVDSASVARSGDDGVAVVSYRGDGEPCHDLEIRAPRVDVTTWGRGVSVVGGHDVTVHDPFVRRSSAAAVYVACEGAPSNTADVARVRFSGGAVEQANTLADIDHGAVLVYCGRRGGSVEDVEISGLTVTGTRSGASRQLGVVTDGDDDRVADIVFRAVTLGAGPAGFGGNAPAGAVALHGVVADGREVRVGAR